MGQRGAGRSFRGDEDAATLTLDRLVEDGVEVVEWARRELSVACVVLLGHSFGTVLGVLIARRIPAAIGAYVGAAQVVSWAVQERRGYEWALGEARRRGHARATAALERLGPPVEGVYAGGVPAIEIERRWLAQLGGVSSRRLGTLGWIWSIVSCPDYPWRAKRRYLAAMRRTMTLLWPELARRIDLGHDIRSLEVPVRLLAGRLDRITPLDLIEDWCAGLTAPSKRLEVVERGGHLVPFEAPERLLALLEEVRGVH